MMQDLDQTADNTNQIKRLLFGLLLFLFFVPPIQWGIKKVFLYDLYLLLIPFFGLYLSRGRSTLFADKKIRNHLIYFTFAVLAVYLHGRFRIDLRDSLAAAGIGIDENNAFGLFSWTQDGILALRFLSWGYAIATIYHISKSVRESESSLFNWFLDLWSKFAVIESVVAIIAFLTPLKKIVGSIFGYDPFYESWADRIYGTFQSPPELAAVIFPTALWTIVKFRTTRERSDLIFAVTILTALILSRSMTSISGFTVGIGFIYRKSLLNRSKAFLFFCLIITTALISLANPNLDQTIIGGISVLWRTKVNNFTFRFAPWAVYLKTVCSRLDFLVLGLGFARTHTDNSYLHILRTGGLTFFIYAISLICLKSKQILKFQKDSPEANWYFGYLFAFLLTMCATDSIIYRGAGTLFFLSCALFSAALKDAQPQ